MLFSKNTRLLKAVSTDTASGPRGHSPARLSLSGLPWGFPHPSPPHPAQGPGPRAQGPMPGPRDSAPALAVPQQGRSPARRSRAQAGHGPCQARPTCEPGPQLWPVPLPGRCPMPRAGQGRAPRGFSDKDVFTETDDSPVVSGPSAPLGLNWVLENLTTASAHSRLHNMFESVTCILLLQCIFPGNGGLWCFLVLSKSRLGSHK